MKSFLQKHLSSPVLFTLLLIWLGGLAYLLLVPWLGLFADDWPFVYVNHIAGFNGVVNFISWVRPFAAPLFALIAAIGGTNFPVYPIVLAALRIGDALLLAWVLRLLFPRSPAAAWWAALIFTVFPAFKQMPLALEYFPHFVALGLFFTSLVCMLKAALLPNGRRAFWLSLIALLCTFSIFIVEYFFGQEFLRPLLLWLVLAPVESDWKRRLRRVGLLWLPYLVIALGFLYWRVFVLGFPSYQPELITQAGSSALAALKTLIKTAGGDLIRVGLGTWMQIFQLPTSQRLLLLTLGVIAAAFLPTLVFLWLFPRKEQPGAAQQRKTGLVWVGLGMLSFILAGAVFWVTKIPLELTFPWDRGTLAFIVGASLFIPGLLMLIPSARLQNVLLAGLVAFSVGLHFQNANLYRHEWELLRSFYWQLSWRIPALEKGTTVVLNNSPFNYHSDKFLMPLLEWTFAPESTSLQTPYLIQDDYKAADKFLPPESSTQPVIGSYGTLKFSGDTAHLLLISYQPPACLRVLHANMPESYPLSEVIRDSLSASNLNLIHPLANPTAQPPAFLGAAPANTWCEIFEKADLAAQQSDWQSVRKLDEQASAAGLQPAYAPEWIIFIQADVLTGNFQRAEQLSRDLLQDNANRSSVCAAWKDLRKSANLSDLVRSQASQIWNTLGCAQ